MTSCEGHVAHRVRYTAFHAYGSHFQTTAADISVSYMKQKSHPMRYLSANDLVNLIPPVTLVAAIEQGLFDFVQDKVIVPARQHLDFGDNTLLSMPVIGEDVFGTKIVSVVPANSSRNLPVTNGLMTLSDGHTGVPLAVLNAAALTSQRTGAVGALGLKYTTPPDTDRLGIIGAGVQGTWQALFACAVRPIKTVCFLERSDENAHRFVNTVSRQVPSVTLTRCRDAHELLTQSSVVIAATTSSDPVLPDEPQLLAKKHYVSIGSFKPSMQELPNAVYQLAQHTVIDADAARREVGDLINPLSSGMLREESILHVAELVVGKRTIDTGDTTVFKSVGMALYDLYAARAFVDEARRLGRGTVFDH